MNEVLKIQKVYLDVKKPIAQPQDIRPIKVGDTGNVFEIELTDNGIAVDLTDCLVLAIFARADGRLAQQDESTGMTINGNVITLKLRTTSFTYGQNKCDIQVYSGLNNATLVTSAEFYFDGARGILNDETIETDENFPILVSLIERIEALGNRTGDMEKEDYDKDGSGIVDDAERLGGEAPSYYATADALRKEISDREAAISEVTPASIGAAKKSVKHEVTLEAANWSYGRYTITVDGVTASSVVELVLPLTVTDEQLEVLQDANIVGASQTENSITVRAAGYVPEIDLPITVIVRGDL